MCLFWVNANYAQTPARVLLSSGNISTHEYQIYEPSKIIKTTISQSKNETIEALMSSILNADSQEKVNFNTLEGEKNTEQKSEKDFLQIKNRNIEKTYFEIISKLEFQSGGQFFSIVKFKLHIEQVPNGISGAYQLQKVRNQWYKTSRSDLSEIALMMVFFKPTILKDLLSNTTTTEILMLDLKKATTDGSGLNFKKLYNEFSTWEKDKIKTQYFLEPTGW